MNDLTRRHALMAVLAAGVCATRVFAQNDSSAPGRDLTVEAAPPRARPWRRPRARVQASLMPVGPSMLSIGQPLRFRMISLADGYGQLYALSASGRTQLWLENARLRAGQPVNYPRQALSCAPPVGSRVPIRSFVGGGASAAPFDLQFTHEALRSTLQQKLDAMPRSDWAIAEVTIRVQE